METKVFHDKGEPATLSKEEQRKQGTFDTLNVSSKHVLFTCVHVPKRVFMSRVSESKS